jgi:hypothetical protein
MEEDGFICVAQQSNSPGSASDDFILFGYFEWQLQARHFSIRTT